MAVAAPHRPGLRRQLRRQDQPVVIRAVAHRQRLVLADPHGDHDLKVAVRIGDQVVAPPVRGCQPAQQRIGHIPGVHRASRVQAVTTLPC